MMTITLSKVRLALLKMQSQENEDVTNIQREAEESEVEVIAASDIACIKADIDVIRLKRKRDPILRKKEMHVIILIPQWLIQGKTSERQHRYIFFKRISKYQTIAFFASVLLNLRISFLLLTS